jgi:hypothetical protein
MLAYLGVATRQVDLGVGTRQVWLKKEMIKGNMKNRFGPDDIELELPKLPNFNNQPNLPN